MIDGRREKDLSFESGYEPHLGEPGREHWLADASHRGAHAWVLRHQDLGRPWLICIPGYGTGMPMIHFSAFDARWLHRDLSFWREPGVRMLIDDALRDSGFVSPR